MKKLFLLLPLFVAAGYDYAHAQMDGNVDFEAPVKREWKTGGEEGINYMPQIFGGVKVKVESSLYDGDYRFNVRSARIGFKGLVSPDIAYQMQVDFHNEGKISVLDAYLRYQKPVWSLTLGQQHYGFSTDLDRGPSTSVFSNRSFIGKFLTTYYDETLEDGVRVNTIGGRDMGLRLRYEPLLVPVRFSGGLFSGTGVNNPEWRGKINFVGRIDIGGKEEGFGAAFSHYNGHTMSDTFVGPMPDSGMPGEFGLSQRMIMWGGELRYVRDDFRVEGEVATRRLKSGGTDATLTAAHVQGYYIFRMAEKSSVKYIAPVWRWDMGDNVEFLTKDDVMGKFNAHRGTLGVNLGFAGNFIDAEIRLQFEKFFFGRKPVDYGRNPLLQDKITLEFVANF